MLLRHPAVAEAVTFAIPHDKLGEEVGAAVVLRRGSRHHERDLRAYLSDQLAAFKVPKRIVFVTEIPKGRDRQAAADRPGRQARPLRRHLAAPHAALLIAFGGEAGTTPTGAPSPLPRTRGSPPR